MKSLFLAIICQFCLSALLLGQSDTASNFRREKVLKNCFHVQTGGTTGWYSVNYERYFRHKRLPHLYLLAGIGYYKIAYKETKWKGSPVFMKVGVEFGPFRADIGVTDVLAFYSHRRAPLGAPGAYYYGEYEKTRFTFLEAGVSRTFWKRLAIGIHAFPIRVSDEGGISEFIDHINMDAYDLKDAGQNWIFWGSFQVGFLF